MGGGEYQLVYWECAAWVDEPMTLNDIDLNAKCMQMKGISNRLSAAMRDGRLGELEVALEAIVMLGKDALDRIKVLRGDFPKQEEKEVS